MLVSTDEYKTFIRVTGTSLDKYYTSLIEYVTGLIQAECKQKLILQRGVTEYYSPRFENYIVLRQRPIKEVTNLWWDQYANYGSASGAFPNSTLQTNGIDYCLRIDQTDGGSRSGILYLLGGQGTGTNVRRSPKLNFEREDAKGSIKVEYTCGFDPVPSDLRLVTLTAARALQNMSQYGGLQVMSESRPHYSYSLGEILNKEFTIRRLLSRYVALGADV